MKSGEDGAIPTIAKTYYLHDQKKSVSFRSPDINKMQVVVIDGRTKIYIAMEANPEEARSRYLSRLDAKGKALIVGRKPTTTPTT